MQNKTVWLFTGGFPYSHGETHIESEILTLSKEFEKIYLIPPVNFNKQTTRILPNNVEVIILADYFSGNKKALFFSNFFFIFKTFIIEFIKTQNKISFVQNFREFLSMFLQRIAEAQQLQYEIAKRGGATHSIFYSYWFSDWATVMSILKSKGAINYFVSRAHRFDVYEHLTSKKIIPFRQFQLKMIDKVLTDSQKAADFMIKNTSYPSKISCSYYGSVDYGLNPFNENDVFRIVSCSILIPRKRVHLIIETLKQISFSVEWIHFGDGELMEDLKKLALELPNNITWDFKGQVSNADVLNYYKSVSVNLFMLVSESEGVPMSLVEACSFGIPMLTCNVGGNPEIVNKQTGLLFPENFNPLEAANSITDFKFSSKNSSLYRQGVRNYWMSNFSAEKNYLKFCKEIKS